jgi:DNA-binding CsgD family transcriptional regulator
MKRKNNPFKQIIILFNTLRYFFDKLPEKGETVDYKTSHQYLDKLKHFHSVGMHLYYVADLRKLKIVEISGSVYQMTGLYPEKILGRNFAFGLKIFSYSQVIDLLNTMIEYHQYVYNKPPEHRLHIKGSMILKVKNGKGGYFTGLLQAAPLVLDSKGHVAVMYSSITDISHFNLDTETIKTDIIDESDPNEIKVINMVTKKNEIKFELSKSEMRILKLLAEGKSTKEIADNLSLSEHTVNTHRRNMIQKNNVKNTAELISKTFHLF